jgi:hypothetical protein
MLDDLDRYLESQNYRFARYADDKVMLCLFLNAHPHGSLPSQLKVV